jgi:hypothetical protein
VARAARAAPARAATLAAAAVLGAAGCDAADKPLSAACTTGADAIVKVLARAPAPVTLAGGTRLSTCVERARSDADLQTVGAAYTQVADALAARAPTSDRAALQLGYLVGATRRGGRRTSGVRAELIRRIEQAAGLDGPPPTHHAAYDRGLAAGERAG